MSLWSHRRGRIALAAAGLALTGCGVLSALVAWRLSRGPIGLDVLTPYIEAELSRPDGSLGVTIGATQLAWDPRRHHIDLGVRDVRVVGRSGETLARLRALSLRLSVRALLRGVIAPSAVEVLQPELQLIRQADGGFDLGRGDGTSAEGGSSLARAFLDDLLGSAGTGSRAEWLRRVAVSDGEVAVVDRETAQVWHARSVELEARREADGIAAHLAGVVAVGESLIPVRASALYRGDPAGADVELSFRALEPAAVAPRLVPARVSGDARSFASLGALLSRVKVAMDGTTHVTLDASLRPRRVQLAATGARGTLVLPENQGGDLQIERIDLAVAADLESDTVEVEHLSLDLGKPTVRVQGCVTGLHGDGTVEGDVTVGHLSTAALWRYWPEDAATGPRGWLTSNVTGGEVRDARVRVTGRISAGHSEALVVDAVTGSLVFDGLAVRYLDSMPAVTGVAGTGTFAGAAWNLHVARGTLAGLDLVRAVVAIAGVDSGTPRIAIEAAVRGPLAKALALLDQKPLGYAGALGVTPAEVSGTTTTRLTLGFPLRSSLRYQDLGLAVSAQLRDVAVPHMLRGWSLAGGDLALELHGQTLEFTGGARIQDAPVTLTWREDFSEQLGPQRRVDVTGRVDAAARAALGFDLRPWIDGPVDVQAHFAQERRRSGELDLVLDLGAATLDLPALGLAKRAGTPGRAKARVAMAGDVVTAIDGFDLAAGDSMIRGRTTFSKDGKTWKTLDAEATIAPPSPTEKPGHLTLAVRPAAAGNTFTLTSNDAGALFRALGSHADAHGGRLVFTGNADVSAPGLPLDGRVDVRDCTVTKWPMLARVATLTSLSGISNALAGRGIEFDRITAGISHRGETVAITRGLASGGSLRILLDGTIDRATKIVALKGTLVPSYYGLNRAPARLPLIGGIISGTRKEGLQAIDFAVTGALDDPQVSVHPLSAIAPGVLRDLMRRLTQ